MSGSQVHSLVAKPSWVSAMVEQGLNVCTYSQPLKCSSVVRAFAHGAMGSSDRSFMGDPLSYFSFQPVLHNGVTNTVVCVILSVG